MTLTRDDSGKFTRAERTTSQRMSDWIIGDIQAKRIATTSRVLRRLRQPSTVPDGRAVSDLVTDRDGNRGEIVAVDGGQATIRNLDGKDGEGTLPTSTLYRTGPQAWAVR